MNAESMVAGAIFFFIIAVIGAVYTGRRYRQASRQVDEILRQWKEEVEQKHGK